ncbi:ion transporter [Luminiphilus sp.]|jgi:voltage-gated potassium channel|nr:ion transporter [Luminiphilus sp.]
MSETKSIRYRTLVLLEKSEDGDLAGKLIDIAILSLVLLNILAVVMESVSSIFARYELFFYYFEILSVAIFSVEYFLRLWANGAIRYEARMGISNGSLRYALSFHGVIDLVAILPFYLQMLLPGLDLRVLRILRLMRVFKLSHYSTALEDLFSAIWQERRSFAAASYLLLLALILTSSIMFYAESEHQPDKFSSIPNAMYWSLITLTTVGYGDVSPVTSIGKVISIFTAFLGVSIVAMLTGIVASAFSNQMARKRVIYEGELRRALADGEIDDDERRLLDDLKDQFGLSDDQTELLFEQVRKETKLTG